MPRTGPGGTGVDTRTRILQIAAVLFRERGYSGTSNKDIAERLGTTTAALYYHFARKEDILDALIAPATRAVEEFIEQAEAGPRREPGAFLREFVLVTVQFAPSLALVMGDPEVMRTKAAELGLLEQQERLVRLLTGPDADDATRVRAHAAYGALRAGMDAVARLCADLSDPAQVAVTTGQYLDTVIASAVAAFRG